MSGGAVSGSLLSKWRALAITLNSLPATLAVVRVIGYLIRVRTVLTGPPDVVQIAGWLRQIMSVVSTN